jgi:DNA-binding beta-propeller fold protein YncE
MKTIKLALVIIVSLLSLSLYHLKAFASVPTIGWLSSHATTTNPYGIDVDSGGNIYIAHYTSSSIRKYDSNGTFISSFGSYGTGNSNFKYPYSVAVDGSGNIYVADTSNHQIKKFNSSYVWQWTVGTTTSGTETGRFNRPHNIVIGPDGNIYVSDNDNYRVQVFDPSGTFLFTFGSRGYEDGYFQGPSGIAFDSDGNIYVADDTLDNVQVFDSTGNFITKFGTYGTGPGQLNGPYHIAIDNQGNINVVDQYNARVTRFASDFSPLTPFGSSGSANGQFNNPRGIAIDNSGNILVTDSSNSRFQKLSYNTTDYQISDVDSSLDITNAANGLNIESGTLNGMNSGTALVRIKDTSGLTITDVSVDLTADRSWAGVLGDSDRVSGKSYVSNLIGAAGVGATHALYVPVPLGRTSQSVYICPNASDLASVTDTCTGGVERTAGSYVEAFGNITVSQVNDLGDSITYWKIEGMTGSGGLAYNLLEFSGNGAGTLLDPYEITSCTELQEMASERLAVYELMNDIDCTATSGWNAGAGFIPIGDQLNPFMGQLLGNSYTIDGLYIDKITPYTGLIGSMSGANVSDVNMTNFNYLVEEMAGGLIGYMENSTVDNIHVSGNIGFTLLVTYNAYEIGGAIGYADLASQITNSTSDVEIDFSPGYGSWDWNEADWVGGFIGVASGATEIDNCSSAGDIYSHYSSYNIGGFIGWLVHQSVITNSYSTGNVYIGLDLNPADGDGDSYDNGGFAGAVGWDGYWLWGRNDAYVYNSYSTGDVYVLGESNYDVGGFIGTLYNNSVIEDSYSEGNVYGGIWNNDVGGFVGFSRQDYGDGTDMARISRSYSTGNVYVDYDTNDVGGFAGTTGWRNITIEDCYSLGSVYGGSEGNEYEYIGNLGGFVGNGSGNSIIRRSFSMGNVETLGESWDVGGFAGYLTGNILIEESASLGTSVNGYGDVGGFVGGMSNSTSTLLATIRDSYSRTNVISRYLDTSDPLGSGADAAGFVGWLRDSAYNIIEDSYSAGAVGMITNPIDNVSTTLTADAPWDATTITVADATNIVAGGYLMLGDPGPTPFNTTLTAPVLVGAVSLDVADASGFAAYNTIFIDYGVEGKQEYAQIQTIVGNTLNLFAATATSLTHDIGAEVRKIETDPREVVLVRAVNGNDITVTREMAYSYNEDWFTGDPVVQYDLPNISGASGGFVGYLTSAPITNSYWDIETSGYATSYGGTGLTTAQMKSSANFSGWDFVDTWGMNTNINDGYPFLSFDDPTFSGISLSDGSLNPSFNRFTTYYTIDVPGTSINFTPNLNQTLYQSLTLDGVPVNNGAVTPDQSLNPGNNTFEFDVVSYSFRPLTYQLDVNSGGVDPTNTPTPTPTSTNTPIPTPSNSPIPTTSTVPTITGTTAPARTYTSPTPTPCLYEFEGECINEIEIKDVITTVNENNVQICWRTNIPTSSNISYSLTTNTLSESTLQLDNQTYFCQPLEDLEYDSDYIFIITATYEDTKADHEGTFKTGLPSVEPVYSCSILADPINAKLDGNNLTMNFTTDNADSCTMSWGIVQTELDNRADLNRSGTRFTSYLTLGSPLPDSIYYNIVCGSGTNQCSSSNRITLYSANAPTTLDFFNFDLNLEPSEFIALTGLLLTITPISIAFPQFWLYGIAWIFPRKKQKPWGIVYDLRTLNPIAFAVVRLFDQSGNMLKQTVSDLQGRFSFLADPGTYQISIEHSEYNKVFKDINILREDSKIAENIGLVSLEGNKPFIASIRNSLGTFFMKTSWILGFLGMIFSFIAMVSNFEFINVAIFAVYVIQMFMMIALRPKRDFGYVYDINSGERIKGAFIQVQDVIQGRQIDVQMSDEKGRFGFNLDKGEYILIVSFNDKKASKGNIDQIQLKDGSLGFKYDTSIKNLEIGLS